MTAIDMSGRRFGSIVVIEKAGSYGSAQHVAWRCECDCGTVFVAVGASIRAGRTLSCGCKSVSAQFSASRTKTHGYSYSRTYRIWSGMHQRCKSTEARKSHLYAKKGIAVCDEWNSFEQFLRDMGEAPPGASIDRVNGNLGYSKNNCRWATAREQGNNTSANRVIEYNGQSLTVSMWGEKVGISPNTLLYRLRRGWSAHEALTTPVQRRRNKPVTHLSPP